MLREWYMHERQIPAYEWAFGDVNPPVHILAARAIYQEEQRRTGEGDRDFLARVFHKLLLNFTWWVNRKDEEGNNLFQEVPGTRQHQCDRPQRGLAGGHVLEQADGPPGWRATA